MINFALVNVFLPSMHGTKLGFMRDILSEAKLFLRQNDVNHNGSTMLPRDFREEPVRGRDEG